MSAKILLVEDEQGIADVFKKQLEMIGGFEVTIASGGQSALDLMEKTKFDVVLLDLVMPDVDGIEVLKKMNENGGENFSVPVIVLTNVTSEETRKEVEGLGAKGYIVKTDIEPQKLIGEINQALSQGSD